MGMFTVAIPLLGIERFGDPGQGPVLLAVAAAAALISNVAVERAVALQHPRHLLAAATATAGTGLAMCIHPTPAAAIIGAVVIGAGDGPQLAALISIRNAESPESIRTRVFTIGASLKIAAAGLGALAAGALSTGGLTVILSVAVATCTIAAAIAIPQKTSARRSRI